MPDAMDNVETPWETIGALNKEIDRLRGALLPFAAAAGRSGGLANPMNGDPLPEDSAIGLAVKVSAWKKAVEVTSAS